jgi:hypothetical protein
MNCLEFRKACGSEPGCENEDFRRHERDCAGCRAHAQELRALDEKIRAALTIPVGAQTGRDSRHAGRSSGWSGRWLSLAASLMLGVGLAAGVWLSLPQPALAEAVSEHLSHERAAWQRTEQAVAEEVLAAVLEDAEIRLTGEVGLISYARTCEIRGRDVPHLMIQGREGPVMVLIMAEEQIDATIPIEAPGYTGLIVPVGSGSIALVGREGEDIGPLSLKFVDSVEWSF